MKFNMKEGKSRNKPVMLHKSQSACDAIGDVYMKTRMIALESTLETLTRDNWMMSSKKDANAKIKIKEVGKYTEDKGIVAIGDFFFMFNEEDDDITDINHIEEKRTNSLVNKLIERDNDYLDKGKPLEQSNSNKRLTQAIKGFEERSRQIEINEKFVEAIYNRQYNSQKHQASKSEEKFQINLNDRQVFRFKTKSNFDFTVFQTKKVEKDDCKLKSILKKKNITNYKTIDNDKEESYRLLIQEQKKYELQNRNELIKLYQKIIISKVKKRKYEGVLEEIYHLFNEATNEYDVVNSKIKARIKRNDDFYRKSLNNIMDLNDPKERLPSIISTLGTDTVTNTNQTIDNDTTTPTLSQSQKNLLILSKKRMSRASIKEDKIEIVQQYVSIFNELKEKLDENNNKFNKIKEELTQMINKNNSQIQILNTSIHQHKILFQTIRDSLVKYYLNKLKLGKDLRSKGLGWIIKRLLELNVPSNALEFPLYLDSEQLDFLIRKSLLEFEGYKLRLLLKTLQLHQHAMINEDHFKRLKNFATMTTSNTTKEDGKSTDRFNRKEKDDRYMKYIECKYNSIYKKHEALLKKSSERKLEDEQIRCIVMTLKEEMNLIASSDGKENDKGYRTERDNVERYLNDHQKQREYMYDMRVLRERIGVISKEIETMKRNEVESYKRKVEFMTMKSTTKASGVDGNVYAALFGNSLII